MPLVYLALHIVLLALLTGLVSWIYQRSRSSLYLGLVVSSLALTQALFLAFPEFLANLTGWADLVFFSEFYVHIAWTLLVASFFSTESRATKIRLFCMSTALLVLAGYASHWLVFQTTTPPGYCDPQGVWRQSTKASCSAAATATALNQLSIPINQREMGRLCLTHPRRGTTVLGMYRGLSLGAGRHGYQVYFVHLTPNQLAKLQPPAILTVGFTSQSDPKLRERHQQSWREGEQHSVVWLGFSKDGEYAYIGDPSVGRERWPMRDFRSLWTGWALVIKR